jgi:enamine deaminase RidA (YjgF/YER057c/UK114 family)
MNIYDVFNKLDIELPLSTKPAGNYELMFQDRKGYLYTSGTGCIKEGVPVAIGLLGREVSIAEGKVAARQCVLNVLANIESFTGDLNRINRVVKTTIFVACTEDFTDQSVVAQGASELFTELFGPKGTGVRSAIGVSALPKGQAVEIEVIFELKDGV